MNNCYLFCDKRSINNATRYYISVVEECLEKLGCKIKVVHHLMDIHSPEIVFVVSSAYSLITRIRFPKVKIIDWQQGVDYEEAKVNRPLIKRIGHFFTEQLGVRAADMLLFTSGGMLEYYQKKICFRKNNYVIMPCHNMPIGPRPELNKYQTPTFVYAGSTDVWQSFDTILDVYAIVEKAIPEAKLYLYCKKSEKNLAMVNDRGIKNVFFDYVTVDELQQRLLGYKYGFIIREKNWINYVATPTKMNSYLASYVIPIFSDGVEDFNRKIDLGEFTLKNSTPLNAKLIASKIIEFEKQPHDFQAYLDKVEYIFATHYNTELYKEQIISKLQELKICNS